MRTLRYTAVAAALAGLAFAGSAMAQPYGGGYGPGYGMMGPGMMGGGYGPGYGMGPGMMGGGYGSGYGMGPGMMGGGYGPGYGMGPSMMGPGYGHPGWGRGPGMMGPGYGRGYGPGMMGGYGPGYARDLNLSTDDVKSYIERTMRNPNLKVGEVKEQGDDEIVATIVTKDKDALVQTIVVNRHTGFFRPEAQ